MQTSTSLPAITRPFSIGRIGGAALAVIAAAAAWQWSWLVAIGIEPLLLSVAPCAAMCGLGLCMRRMGGRACGSSSPHGQLDQSVLEPLPATKET